jgi:hypothetical protein
MTNLRLFAANGNGKGKFVFLCRQTTTVVDDCCFSKRAHLSRSLLLGTNLQDFLRARLRLQGDEKSTP